VRTVAGATAAQRGVVPVRGAEPVSEPASASAGAPASGEMSLGSMRTVEDMPAAAGPVDATATMPPVRSGATPVAAQPAHQTSHATARIQPVGNGQQAATGAADGLDEGVEHPTRRVVTGQAQGQDAATAGYPAAAAGHDAESGHTAVLPPVVAGGRWSPAQALDPATPLADLAKIVQEAPHLRPQVAANPSTYPALLDWLGALGDPQVDAALRSRR
jgi:hypothetical protein